MDTQIPITLSDELLEEVIISNAKLNLASGEITAVEYINYDVKKNGLPANHPDYTYTSGIMKMQNKEIEFAVEVNSSNSEYSLNPDELEEMKEKATALISNTSPTKKTKKRI
jgi:hypothetical protein